MALIEPLKRAEARKLISEILKDGSVSFSTHADKELGKDRLTTVDAINVLRGGMVREIEFEHGSWRYRVDTQYIAVILVFRSETEIRVVTVWRYNR